MTSALLRFEWRFQTRRPAFGAIGAVCFGLGFAFAATAFGPPDVLVNAPYAIAQSTGVASLVGVLAATVFCGQAALRDTHHRMTEIVFATTITKRQYLITRFVGAVGALVASFAFIVPGLLAGTHAVAHDPGTVGPISAGSYLHALVVIALPNLLFAGAVIFAVALATQNEIATYVAGVLVYFLYFGAAVLSGSPLMAGSVDPTDRALAIAAVADPFGLSAFFATTRYWLPAERNTSPVGLSSQLVANRAIWLAMTALLLGGLLRVFSLRLPGSRPERSVGEQRDDPAHPRPVGAAVVATGPRAALRVVGSLSWFELRHAVRGWPLMSLFTAWLGFVVIELVQTFGQREFGTAWLPTTTLVLREIGQPFAAFGTLLVVFFTAELVWRERVAGMDEIVDATPVPNVALLAAKTLALAGLVTGFGIVAMCGTVAFQLARGYTNLEPGLYLRILPLFCVPLYLLIVLAVAVQSLVANRHIGIVVSALLVAFWHLGALGGPEHPLLRYAALPDLPMSDVSGVGTNLVPLAWRTGYWLAFAVFLLSITAAIWRRGPVATVRSRVWQAVGARGRAWRLTALVAVLAWCAIGTVLVGDVRRTGGYRSEGEIDAWRAAYERTYRFMEPLPQPVLVDVAIDVDLRPTQRRAEIRGRCRLENRSGVPLREIFVTMRRDVRGLAITVNGQRAAEVDDRYGVHRFVLPSPLSSSASARIDFELGIDRNSIAIPPDPDVVENGSVLMGHAFLPTLGYRRSFELEDPAARARHGLPPVARPDTFEEADAAGAAGGSPTPFRFDATIATDADQTALAPGQLVDDGWRGGRRVFHYRADAPISPVVVIASARYEVRRRMHDGVAVEVYHHPGHASNVDAMLDAAERTLDYGRHQLGPYPHAALRIVEVASSSPIARRGTGFAVPGMVFLLEHAGFLTDRSDTTRVDVVSKRVAHEVAHQWFGHQLSPAPAPGASALVETTARDTELRALAMLQGNDVITPVLGYELDRYLEGRGRQGGTEAPLVSTYRQGFVSYSKGALVMTAIRDLIGDAATERALRRLMDLARSGRQPSALDMLAALQEGADAPARTLIADWWTRVVMYDLRLVGARTTSRPDGRICAELDIIARRTGGTGKSETRLAFDETIEIAFYADPPDPSGTQRGPTPVSVHRVHLLGDATLTLDAPGGARFALLDPKVLRIDRNRADNLRPLED